jgi:hypothetical protein
MAQTEQEFRALIAASQDDPDYKRAKEELAAAMVLGFVCGLAGSLVTPLALTLADKWLARWKARHGIAV